MGLNALIRDPRKLPFSYHPGEGTVRVLQPRGEASPEPHKYPDLGLQASRTMSNKFLLFIKPQPVVLSYRSLGTKIP